MTFKPTSPYVLLAANAGVVYVGAVFVYMGSQAFDETTQVFSTGSMLSGAAVFLVVVGVLGMVIGGYGAFVARFRTEAHLRRHASALGLLVVVFLSSCAVGLVMYLQSTNWGSSYNTFMKSSQAAYVESFGQMMCPLALGYSCHAAKMNKTIEGYEAVQRLLIPSLPSGPWGTYTYNSYVSTWGVNETVAAAFSNQPRNSGYFIDLCTTVASRVQALGPAKGLASELQRACSACRAVAPVQELPRWIQPYGYSNYYWYREFVVRLTPRTTVACMDALFPSEWTQYMRRYGMPDKDRLYDVLSWDFLYVWSDYSLAICISSGIMAVTTALLVHESRRSLKELFPPPT